MTFQSLSLKKRLPFRFPGWEMQWRRKKGQLLKLITGLLFAKLDLLIHLLPKLQSNPFRYQRLQLFNNRRSKPKFPQSAILASSILCKICSKLSAIANPIRKLPKREKLQRIRFRKFLPCLKSIFKSSVPFSNFLLPPLLNNCLHFSQSHLTPKSNKLSLRKNR